MIIVTIRMVVLANKKRELQQALAGLAGAVRSEKGHVSYHIGQDIEDEKVIYIWERWQSQKDLDNHWRSDRFSALLGSSHLLAGAIELQMHTVSHTKGIEAARSARGEQPAISKPVTRKERDQ